MPLTPPSPKNPKGVPKIKSPKKRATASDPSETAARRFVPRLKEQSLSILRWPLFQEQR